MLEQQGYMHAHAHVPRHMHEGLRACTHKYVIFIAFTQQKLFVNAPHCYVMHKLPVLFVFTLSCGNSNL